MRTTTAFIVTVIWLAAGGFYIFVWTGWENLLAFTPNEIGDFLAAFFAPLAFFWVIVGYFQQGKELSLQREELKLQREETSRLADQAERQAAAISANELHVRRDTFLRIAEMIIDEQVTLASIMLGVIAGNETVKLTREQFGQGDNYIIFQETVRHIFPENVDDFRNKISQRAYRSKTVSRFIYNFERLLNESDEADPDGLLRNQFEESPIGTLYAGVCLIEGWENIFKFREIPDGPDKIF